MTLMPDFLKFILYVLLLGVFFYCGAHMGEVKERIKVVDILAQGECASTEAIEYEACMKETRDILERALNGR